MIDFDYSCLDGNLYFKYYVNSYTEEEKTRFKSKNYCLQYGFGDYEQDNITNKICHNAILASVGNSGVSCGYSELKIYLGDGSIINYKTCILFNDDILINKNLGLWTKMMAEELIKMANTDKKELLNYKLIATNSIGKYFTYDSLTNIVESNNAIFLCINFFGFILFLI